MGVKTAFPAINSLSNTTSSTQNSSFQDATSRKRKREGDTSNLTTLERCVIRVKFYQKATASCFVLTNIQPCPSSIYDKPYTLKPLRLLRRSQLPLSFLDPSPASTTLPSTRLFTSHIEGLETENGGTEPGRLLIASLESESSLYAVERVKRGVYALCRLYSWVKIGYLDDSSSAACTPLSRPPLVPRHDGCNGEWWKTAVAFEDVTGLGQPVRRPRLSMAPPLAASEDRPPSPTLVAVPVDSNPATPEHVKDAQEHQTSSQQVFETLVQQYLEALYKSKTSLAFFAKGPLSRARAACILAAQGEPSLTQLETFLRTMLLNMSAMDKKYKEKLPSMIKDLPSMSWSDYEQEASTTLKKRRSKKLSKLSREGTYHSELDHVKRWWYGESSGRQEETTTQLMKRRIGDLRVRETLAQVILILEILALEATPEFKTARETQKPEQEENQNDGLDPATKKKRKPRKTTDVIVLLDLLMDKLSIWQSVEIDTDAGADDVSLRDNDDKLHDRDLLANFCTEVVIPLYVFQT
jgi:DNA replication regulator SLD3